MTKRLVKTFLVCFTLSTFLSCKGQVNPKTDQVVKEVQTSTIGTIVTEIDDRIWAIYQDTKGNYWFGSRGNGAFLYDGKNLKKITREDGLLSSAIRGFQEDDQGNIFIETPNGVNKYDGKAITTIQVKRSIMNPWILEESDLWFNCNGEAQHIYRYDGEMIYELKLPPQDLEGKLNASKINQTYSPYTVFGIDKDKDGNLWIGTSEAGAFRFDGKEFLWVGEKELSVLPDGRVPGVRSMLEDKHGYMWLSNFMNKYEIADSDPAEYKMVKAVDLSPEIEENKFLYFNDGFSDRDGNLWMVSYGGGVWKYDGDKLENYEISEGGEGVLMITIYKDREGVMWLGTDNNGVYRYDGEEFEKFYFPN